MLLDIIRKLFLSYIFHIEIYLVYIHLMRKRCQLINVDVDIEELEVVREAYHEQQELWFPAICGEEC